MEFNMITAGIQILGCAVKKLNIENTILDVEREAQRSFSLNINEPEFLHEEDTLFAQMTIEFELEIEQSEEEFCNIELSLEGAFLAEGYQNEEEFKERVELNGAAALIGIARGKIESISANIFNNGKIVIPFINVVDYYKSVEE